MAKLFELEWKFNPDQQDKYEHLLMVHFKQKDNGYFVIDDILFTTMDILNGLETLNFVFTKYGEIVRIEIVE